jgi:hypothetical protein
VHYRRLEIMFQAHDSAYFFGHVYADIETKMLSPETQEPGIRAHLTSMSRSFSASSYVHAIPILAKKENQNQTNATPFFFPKKPMLPALLAHTFNTRTLKICPCSHIRVCTHTRRCLPHFHHTRATHTCKMPQHAFRSKPSNFYESKPSNFYDIV